MDIFLEKLKNARKLLQLSQVQLAEAVGIAQKDVSNIENGSRQYIPNQYISFLQEKGIDIRKLYDPDCDQIDFSTKVSLEGENVEVICRGDRRGNSKSQELPLQITEEPIVLYLPQKTREVVMLTQEAAASISGIISGQQRPEEASRILLPVNMLSQSGDYYGFKVKSDSMQPTFYSEDWAIGRYIEPQEWGSLKNEHIYVISTREQGVMVKRIRNRLAERNELRCRSDNRSVPSFSLSQEVIVALFEVKCRLSFNFPNEPALLAERVAKIEDRMDDLENQKKPEK